VCVSSSRNIEQYNIKFCVKAGKNTNDTCATLPKAYGGEDMKKSSTSDWHKQFKSAHIEITHEDNDHHFLQYQRHYSL
jgi:hypothetical protein